MQIDHVGILVTDLERTLRSYAETLGLTAGPIETHDDPLIRRVCPHVGDAEIELIEARSPERTMMQFLPYRHRGVYHIALRADDVDAPAAHLRAHGVPLINGVREAEGMRIQYLHPAGAAGTLIEVAARKR